MSSARSAKASYLRSFIFGVEDSLVSTVGLLSGIAMGGAARSTVIMTGVVLILVEAFSMAAGSFLSESSAEEYSAGTIDKVPLIDSAIMFVSYVVAGLIPLAPYVLYPADSAFRLSIALALLTLFLLGIAGAAYVHKSKRSIFRRGIRMLVIGGVAILVGVVAGMVTGM